VSEANQLPLPASFIALFVPAGRIKPTASREAMAARYEFCEDLASALTERASTLLWELGVTEADVLDRMLAGLTGEGSAVSAVEARWVVCRLAELLEWPMPELSDVSSRPSA
jgi:hypothetical protein